MASPAKRSTRTHSAPTLRAFTIIELLVVIAIIGVLAALLIPAARGTLVAARSFKCQAAQRGVAFDFTVFADDSLHGNRGDDERLPGDRFRLETFIESQYRIDEFWGWGTATQHTLPDLNGNDLMRCPEVEGTVLVMRNTPCSAGAVQPPQNISFGFNVRLHAASAAGGGVRNNIELTAKSVLEAPESVPLVWDVDGAAAAMISDTANPLFSGPSLDQPGFENFWYPALRHAKRMNAAFLDGSVRETRDPLAEESWAWEYSPVR